MGKYHDRVGEKIGRLTIIKRAQDHLGIDKKPRIMWECVCDCGNTVVVRGDSLNKHHTNSCGCLHKERVSELSKRPEFHEIKYGDSRERLRNIWYLMKYRCENTDSPAYKNYGQRGISVCDEWSNGDKGYFLFKEWALANGYDDSLTIDRIDNNLGYSPENCRWIDSNEQANNKRSNVYITHNGESLTVAQWARKLGLNKATIYRRIEMGWDPERALTQPIRSTNK